tara:strand:+ start:419 stop:574 length:156 start_codon:yes stop_codon:yes gene_type:complete
MIFYEKTNYFKIMFLIILTILFSLSMYAVSKKPNALMAHEYSKIYKVWNVF